MNANSCHSTDFSGCIIANDLNTNSGSRMYEHEGYISNPDMENFVDQEFMRAIEQEEGINSEKMAVMPPNENVDSDGLKHSSEELECQQTASSPGREDLPEDIIQAGWRRFWSGRENRFYYFNKLTNSSLWDMPVLAKTEVTPRSPEGTPSMDDCPTDLKSTSTNESSSKTVLLKRKSTDDTMCIVENKQARVEKYWNFDIKTDVIVMEGPPCNFPPPTPEVEQYRASLTNQLRQHYHDMCQSREGIDAPHESFNRWILERKVCDKGMDPMLPTDCPSEVSPSMYREIMHDIPVRLARIKYISDARKQLFCYAEAAKKRIETRNASPESRKLVKWHTEETFAWLRKEQNALLEDYLDRLAHLRRQCGPHLAETAKVPVEAICKKMYNMAKDYAKKILDKNLAILGEHKIDIPPQPEPMANLVCSAPAVMITPSPTSTGVTIDFEKNHVSIRYKTESIRIKRQFFKKLEMLYRCSCHDDPSWSNFLPRLWSLLRRYKTMFGPNQYEGIVLQGALPVPVFECIHKTFGVTMECFASPLNCYFKHYCSAFTDTDSYFGSSGPVLQFFPVSGSFEANAPFEEELMEAMVDHFERLLAQTNDPLSFIVFVPEWRDPTPVATLHMEISRFKRKQVLIPALEHEYRSGLQHVAPENEIYHKSVHGTLLFFLQNDAGFEKWGPTPERLCELLSAFQPKARSSKLATSPCPD